MEDDGERRKADVLVKEKASLEVRRNFFTVRAERLWNSIPEWVKNQRTINAFKNAYDRWTKMERQIEENQIIPKTIERRFEQNNGNDSGNENGVNL